jgi:hypothetical protein
MEISMQTGLSPPYKKKKGGTGRRTMKETRKRRMLYLLWKAVVNALALSSH